jgi:hypothetical protein
MEKMFYAVLAAVVIFVSTAAQYAWCAETQPVKATLKITVTQRACANGKCSVVKQYSVPVQINAPACKNGKCNLPQTRKGNSNGK